MLLLIFPYLDLAAGGTGYPNWELRLPGHVFPGPLVMSDGLCHEAMLRREWQPGAFSGLFEP